ncbi:MAG: septum formation inhibitor Maf [Proteobacteria bacterium]|nr:septum formation inhibitor Maf [Pseudomonadota bacterium]
MTRFDSITLASASPRRSLLLEQIGVRHVVRATDVDERVRPGEAPAAYVARVAADKAEAAWALEATRPVLAADTAVALGAELFGKPADQSEGVRMLAALAGRTHQVLTAVALRTAQGLGTALSVSEVRFRALSAAECVRYWQTGEPRGKAGGYAIQGLAATFITHLAGSYSGVMGLPLAETAQLLAAAGVRLWNSEEAA